MVTTPPVTTVMLDAPALVRLVTTAVIEVAETKVTQVMDFARQHQHPLQCTLEKD